MLDQSIKSTNTRKRVAVLARCPEHHPAVVANGQLPESTALSLQPCGKAAYHMALLGCLICM